MKDFYYFILQIQLMNISRIWDNNIKFYKVMTNKRRMNLSVKFTIISLNDYV